MTQEEVSEAAGLGRNALSDLEAGRRRPSFDTVVAVARGMDVPLSELIATYERFARDAP